MKKITLLIPILIITLFSVGYLLNKEDKKAESKFSSQNLKEDEQKLSPALTAILKELKFKESYDEIPLEKKILFLEDKKLNFFTLKEGFYSGIHEPTYGSGYIDFDANNLLVLSSRGILAYTKDINKTSTLKQIKNNINNFIGIKQFKKSYKISLKDLLIDNSKIYISYVEEILDNCFNTSIISADLNYNNIQFTKFFSNKQCVEKKNGKEFNAHQSGGRIIKFDDNNILLTVGDYRSRSLAQQASSINGKVIKINIINKKHKIISMGHRNPQGLYYDKDKDLILETEHGPMGGDEINIIQVKDINKNKKLNFGWPIVSAGEHYGGRTEKNNEKYKKYPLYKSHTEYGFIEPLISFVPSIGISEIVKIGKDKYAFGSMGKDREGDKSLYFLDLNSKNKIKTINKIKINERVRDLKFKSGKLYMFLENTSSIGIMSIY